MWLRASQDCRAGDQIPKPSERRDRKGAPMAGKPQTLATTSAFEILGPVMVGPSSSHTAGALRCAQVAASLLEGASPKSPLGCGTPSPTPTAATAPTVRSSRASWASTPMTRTSSRPSTSHASSASNITLTSRATTLYSPQYRRHRYGRRHGRHGTGSRREPGRWQDAHQPH